MDQDTLSGPWMDFEPGHGGRWPRVADLDHQDRPDDEDLEELDRRTMEHIARLIAEFEGDEEAEFEGRVQEADRLEDARIGEGEEEGEGDERGSSSACTSPPAEAPGPLAGSLAQLAFKWGSGPRPAPRKPDRTRPGDAPGWKGGGA